MNWVRRSWDHPNSSKQLAQLCFRKRVWCQRLHWSSWPINSLTVLLPYLIASCFTVLAWMRSPEIAWLLAPLPRLFACWLRLDCIVWQWIHHSLFVPEQCHLKMQNFTIEQSVCHVTAQQIGRTGRERGLTYEAYGTGWFLATNEHPSSFVPKSWD